MVHSPVAFLRKLQTSSSSLLAAKLVSYSKHARKSMKYSGQQLICRDSPLLIQLTYLTLVSFAGYTALKILRPRDGGQGALRDIDLLFTSVSASTVSSMATVEMEDFSSAQLCVLAVLMLVGGEVFTSMLDLYFVGRYRSGSSDRKGYSVYADIESTAASATPVRPSNTTQDDTSAAAVTTLPELRLEEEEERKDDQAEPKTVEALGYALLVYLLVTNLGSSLAIYLYFASVPDARGGLERKGIGSAIFSAFTAVSSVANCGFTPVNENMVAFQKRPVLLLLLVPQILAGNTLLAPCLRLLLRSLEKATGREEYRLILQRPAEAVVGGCRHLMSGRECVYLTSTVLGLIVAQTVLFCSLEWSSEALRGMSGCEKVVAALFQSTNARHAGENVVDLSSLSPAILVLYTVAMYLPGETSFLPAGEDGQQRQRSGAAIKDNRARRPLEDWVFSPPAYLAIFVMLVCVTEREAMRADPLNFNVFSLLFEVVSAYGNVGFSVGYSCERMLRWRQRGGAVVHCEDASYGFVGAWSGKGKVVLIVVMVFGRLKAFGMKGGRAWRLR